MSSSLLPSRVFQALGRALTAYARTSSAHETASLFDETLGKIGMAMSVKKDTCAARLADLAVSVLDAKTSLSRLMRGEEVLVLSEGERELLTRLLSAMKPLAEEESAKEVAGRRSCALAAIRVACVLAITANISANTSAKSPTDISGRETRIARQHAMCDMVLELLLDMHPSVSAMMSGCQVLADTYQCEELAVSLALSRLLPVLYPARGTVSAVVVPVRMRERESMRVIVCVWFLCVLMSVCCVCVCADVRLFFGVRE